MNVKDYQITSCELKFLTEISTNFSISSFAFAENDSVEHKALGGPLMLLISGSTTHCQVS
jgi:hypothetical protein